METLDTVSRMGYIEPMSKDYMREYLAIAVEAYDLSSTPDAHSIYRDTLDECEPLDAPVMFVSARKSQLEFGIDIKRIFDRFIAGLTRQYGPHRAERFITWVKVGFIEQFHTDNRMEIKWDRRRLGGRLARYRHTKPQKNA